MKAGLHFDQSSLRLLTVKRKARHHFHITAGRHSKITACLHFDDQMLESGAAGGFPVILRDYFYYRPRTYTSLCDMRYAYNNMTHACMYSFSRLVLPRARRSQVAFYAEPQCIFKSRRAPSSLEDRDERSSCHFERWASFLPLGNPAAPSPLRQIAVYLHP